MPNQRLNLNNIPSARRLRSTETPAEAVLWEALRGRRLNGIKFRRQHPIGPFVADFCATEWRLIVELDGEVHAGQGERDREREELLWQAGYAIVRFSNQQVIYDLPRVLGVISDTYENLPSCPPRYMSRREGW